jgi:hypothetical protein
MLINSSLKLSLELKPSKIHKGGVGVFAVEGFRKGQKVAEGVRGEDFKYVIPWKQFSRFQKNIQRKILDFCIGIPKGFIPPNDMNFDALTAEWYFNHSCNGNLGFDKKGDFIALRHIKKGEELSYDYGLAESTPKFKMKCMCGNKNCRQYITGDDWKNPVFRKKWLKYMLPNLKKI